jgi:hypothetical protein
MIPQSASISPFSNSQSSHLHIDNEKCPWCEQDIPPEKLEEVSGKIVAKELMQEQAIAAKLEQQHAIERAQAGANRLRPIWNLSAGAVPSGKPLRAR